MRVDDEDDEDQKGETKGIQILMRRYFYRTKIISDKQTKIDYPKN